MGVGVEKETMTELSHYDLSLPMGLCVFVCVSVEGGGWGLEVFSPLGSDPDSAVKSKPYIIRPWLNPIMSVLVGVCWTGTRKGS